MTTVHDIGDAEKITATFKNSSDALTNPTTVTFTMIEPDGTTTLYTSGVNNEISSVATGIWNVTWTFTQEGRHHVVWKGVGALIEAGATEFYCKRQAA